MDEDDLQDIVVLLVDDDTDWLELTASLLERNDDALEVLRAEGGWEALDHLETETVDCVVCDYQMTNMDGIAVLERVRSMEMDLPFIIVTGSGDESVASRAISSEVTDYFVKEPARDQSRSLAARIRSAVATHRTRQELARTRRQFTGLFENVPDPVAIVHPTEGIQRVNDAFERTFEVGEGDVHGTSIGECVGGDLDGATNDEPAVRTLTLSTVEGSRDFLVRRFSLSPETPEVGYLFTDVTDQRDRQRALRDALTLDAEVRELLLSAASRAELEQSFCETVAAREGALLAVIVGAGPDGAPDLRASAGPLADRAAEIVDDGAGPLGVALEEGTAQYVPSTGDREEAWARRSLVVGANSVLAVPVDRNGVASGAFAVYDERPGAYDGESRGHVEDLVSSLGDGIALVERMGALAADRVLRTRLSVTGEGTLARTAGDTDSRLEVTAVTRTEEGIAVYVDVADGEGEAVRRHLRDQESVDTVETVVDAERTRLRLTAADLLPELIADRGASIASLEVGPSGTYEGAVDVLPAGDVETVVEVLEDRFDRVTVRSITNADRDRTGAGEEGPLSTLTDRQRDALEAAFYEGYFERPRKNTSEDVAGTLSISSTTFLEHLRAANRKVLAELLGSGNTRERDED